MKKILKTLLVILITIICLIYYSNIKKELKPAKPANQNIEQSDSVIIPYIPLSERENSIIFEYDGDNISSLTGEKIFIAFWSSYCKYCKDEFKALKEAQEKIDDITFVLISHDENIDELRKYLNENNGNFFVIHNPSKSIRSKLNSEDKYIPSLYLLDSTHNIIRQTNKILNADKIIEFIKKK